MALAAPHLSSVERWSPGCGDEFIHTSFHPSTTYLYWLVVEPPFWKIWVRQWEGLSHILWKIINVPNHQPVYIYILCKYCIYVYIYIYIYIYISITFATSLKNLKMKLQLWSWQECFSNLIHALLVKNKKNCLVRYSYVRWPIIPAGYVGDHPSGYGMLVLVNFLSGRTGSSSLSPALFFPTLLGKFSHVR